MCSLLRVAALSLSICHAIAWRSSAILSRKNFAPPVDGIRSTDRRPQHLHPLQMGLFDNIPNPFDKASSIFEESTTLGKGVTYAKMQVALEAQNRGPESILGILAAKADAADTDSARGLANLVNEVRGSRHLFHLSILSVYFIALSDFDH